MSIRAVIGAGPRTGTSFVMGKLAEAGLPVYHTPGLGEPDEGNPLGYFETCPAELPDLEDVIVKVWPGAHRDVEIEKAVLLVRKREPQLRSIRRQMEREGFTALTAEEVVDMCMETLDPCPVPDVMMVRTEELNEKIGEIIKFLGG